MADGRYVAIPSGGTVFAPNGYTDQEVYDYVGYKPPLPEPSRLGVAVRGAVGGVLPAIGGVVGGGLGAAAGSALPGPGTLVGAVGGALAGSTAASEAQAEFFKDHPDIANFLGQSPEQQAADQNAHKYIQLISQLAPALLTATPGLGALARIPEGATGSALADALATRTTARVSALTGAGLGAGIDLGQQAASDNPDGIDWDQVALQAAGGALLQNPTRLGKAITPFHAYTEGRIADSAQKDMLKKDAAQKAANFDASPEGSQARLFDNDLDAPESVPAPAAEEAGPPPPPPPAEPTDQTSMFDSTDLLKPFSEADAGAQGRLFDKGADEDTTPPIAQRASDTAIPPSPGGPQQGLFDSVPTAEVPSMVGGIKQGDILRTLRGVDETDKPLAATPKLLKLSADMAKAAAEGDHDTIASLLADNKIPVTAARRGESWASDFRDLDTHARDQEAANPAPHEVAAQDAQAAAAQAAVDENNRAIAQNEQIAADHQAGLNQDRVLTNRGDMLAGLLATKDPTAALRGFHSWVTAGKGEHGLIGLLPHEREAYEQAVQRAAMKYDAKVGFGKPDEPSPATRKDSYGARGRPAPEAAPVIETPAPKGEQVEPPVEQAAPVTRPNVLEVAAHPDLGTMPRAVAEPKPVAAEPAPKQIKTVDKPEAKTPTEKAPKAPAQKPVEKQVKAPAKEVVEKPVAKAEPTPDIPVEETELSPEELLKHKALNDAISEAADNKDIPPYKAMELKRGILDPDQGHDVVAEKLRLAVKEAETRREGSPRVTKESIREKLTGTRAAKETEAARTERLHSEIAAHFGAKDIEQGDFIKLIGKLRSGKLDEVAAELKKLPTLETPVNKYKEGTPEKGSVRVKDAQATVDKITKNWKTKLNVKVVEDVHDLPADVAESVRKDGAENSHGLVAKDGTVYILSKNLSSHEDILATLYHEGLGHSGLSKLFRDKLDAALTQMHNTNPRLREEVAAWRKANPDAYKGDAAPLARAVEEVLAKRSEGGQIDATPFQKLASIVKDFARRMGLHINMSDREVNAVLARAHDSIINGSGPERGAGGNRYMYGGREGKAGDHRMLVKAKLLESAGKDSGPDGEIRKNTGWFKAADGKWRFEFSDKNMAFKRGFDFGGLPHLSETEMRQIRPLSDIINHSELFRNYPEMETMAVRFRHGTGASIDEERGRITLGIDGTKEDLLDSIVHEVQHAIQFKEGFSRGSSSDSRNITASSLTKLKAFHQDKLETAGKDPAMVEMLSFAKRHGFKAQDGYPLTMDNMNRTDAYRLLIERGIIPGSPESMPFLRVATHASDSLSKLPALDDLIQHREDTEAYKRDLAQLQEAHAKRLYKMKGASLDEYEAAEEDYHNDVMELRDKYSLSHTRSAASEINLSDDRDSRSIADDHYFMTHGEIESRDTEARRYMNDDERKDLIPYSSRVAGYGDTKHSILHDDVDGEAYSKKIADDEKETVKNVKAQPTYMQQAAQKVADVFGGKGVAVASKFGMTNQVTDLAAHLHMNKAVEFQRQNDLRGAAVNKLNEAPLKWAGDVRTLSHKDFKAMNNIMQDMTVQRKWGFMPDYMASEHLSAITKVDEKTGIRNNPVDAAMAKRFDALPAKTRQLVKEGFKLGYDIARTEKEADFHAITETFGPKIERARAALEGVTDPVEKARLEDKVAKLELSHAEALSASKENFGFDMTSPYAPMTRRGDWIVLAKSPEYIAAEKAAQDGGDTKTLAKLQGDADHFYVGDAGSQAEANTLKRAMVDKWGEKNIGVMPRNNMHEKLYGGRDTMMVLHRLGDLVEDTGADEKTRNAVADTIHQMQLLAMTQRNARKAQMTRNNVASNSLNMADNIMSRARASAHLVAGLYHNADIANALRGMQREVQWPNGEHSFEGVRDRQQVFTGLLERHLNGLTPQNSPDWVGKVNALTSTYMLAFKPAYYIQQLTQTPFITGPVLAGEHGAGRTSAALTNAAHEVVKAWGNSGVSGPLDLHNVSPHLSALAHLLYERNALDVGSHLEMGSLNRLGEYGAVGKAFDTIKAMSRKVEQINRFTAGTASFMLDKAALAAGKGLHLEPDERAFADYQKAFEKLHAVKEGDTPPKNSWTDPATGKMYDHQPFADAQELAMGEKAVGIVKDTHGDLSLQNSPLVMRSATGKLMLQFKKFPITMLGMWTKHINNAFFNPEATPVEQKVARATLMYLFGTMGALAGGMGIPGYNVASGVYNWLNTDDTKRGDFERDVRKAIGDDTIANLILRGVPTLAGVNASASLGQGNISGVAPYADFPHDRDSTYKFVGSLAGPAIGGLLPQFMDGMNYMSKGDYVKGAEQILPKGLSDVVRTAREQTKGETDRHGEITARPDQMPPMDAVWSSLGFPPVSRTDRAFARDEDYQDKTFYKDKVTGIKQDYIAAQKEGNTQDMASARDAWAKIQDARVAAGFTREPMSELFKAPMNAAKAERNTIGGVHYNKQNKGEVESLSRLTGMSPEDALFSQEDRSMLGMK